MKYLILTILTTLFGSASLASGTHEHSHDHEGAKYAVGMPGKGQPDRVISVSMRDTMRFIFEPELESLEAGETIEFKVTNDGEVQHEFSIGSAEEQRKHAEMMKKMPNMEHNDPNTVSLAPGKSATLIWKFTGDETVVFACNIPGHFEAGMKHVQAIGEGGSKGVVSN